MAVQRIGIERRAGGPRGAGRGGRLVLSFALAALVGLVSGRPASAQASVSLPELDTHRVHGLLVKAPSPLRELRQGRAAIDRTVERSPAISEMQLYLWNRGDLGASVGHLTLEAGADYDLRRGLKGSLDRTTRHIGGRPKTSLGAYSVRATEVSGHRALVGSNRVRVSDGIAILRVLVTRAGRDVWIVMVFGREGPRLAKLSDAVLGSVTVEGS